MSFFRNSLMALATLTAATFTASFSPTLAAGGSEDGSAQIVGGTQAPAGKWPFQVALVTSSVSDNYQAQFCGATLVKKNYILTAAHCITNDAGGVVAASSLKVLVGTQDLGSGGKRYTVSKIYRHPSYNSSTYDYDVAVLKLSTSVTSITPVTLIKPSQESTLAAVGDQSYVIGWGNTVSSGTASYPTKLRQVKIPILSRTKCNQESSYNGALTSRMICAGTFAGGKDSCQGDSGGPLIVANASGTFKVQAGVVSWGNGCALSGYPGIYTRLAQSGMNAWVVSKISQ
jgi:secreted trypsin-like serine protease